ncbi:hypothetical protein [Sinorhizobium meliloti]|uniref:hypothetical protein n=1 Tax=Rhizobium meliloti TaxID=382 RepID=UPI000FDC334F|nr:hypothetical protein [Sinorhizobium meliloti]RVH27884.1 hypothetical protein CN211_26505 [Sinorhizobium meliloti]
MPTLELQLVMNDNGRVDYGSGFLLRHASRNWLITCQHNMESGDPLNLTGSLDCREVKIRRPFQSSIKTDGRTVVGARIDGVLADCAAIELFQEDIPNDLIPPSIETKLPYAVDTPVGLTLLINGSEHKHIAAPDRQLLVEGYADGEVGHVGLRKYRCAEFAFLDRVKPFMLMFHPGATQGVSGGPVVELHPDGHQNLLAIYTHNANQDLTLDHTIKAVVRTGAAVPLPLLLKAIDQSSLGIAQIVDLKLE